MKRTNFAAVLAVFSMIIPCVFGQGEGAKFNTRDAKTCPSTKEPVKGAISVAQASQYVACTLEETHGYGELRLIENIKLEIGSPRPYNANNDLMSEIDISKPVYPLRGTYTVYTCYLPAGKNCRSYDVTNGTGACWKTSFGDWKCSIAGTNFTNQKSHQPGPGAR